MLLLAPLLVLAFWDPRGQTCVPYTPFTADPQCVWAVAHDYGIGSLVAAQLLGVHALAPLLWRWLRPIANPVAWLAGASFTLYLLHYPLLHFIAAATPWPADHWARRVLVFLLPPLLALVVAEVTERRHTAWRRAIAVLVGQR